MLQEHEINRLLLENLQSVIYLCKNDDCFTPLRLNGQIEAMSGYQVDDFLSGEIKIPDLYHPDDRKMIYAEVQKAAKERRAFHLMHRMHHRDGRWVWVESIGKLLLDEDDPEKTYITGLLIDISDRKQMQDELRKLSEIVQHSPASVVVTDSAGKIEYVNPKFEELTGYSFTEAVGANPSILKSGYQSDTYYQNLWETILSGEEWRGEFSNKKKNGEIYWELASISPIMNDAGKIESFVAIKEDITDRKHAEQALEEAKAALEDQVLALERRNRQIALFSEMQEALLNCEEETEARHVLVASAVQLFPHFSGNLFEVTSDKETTRLTGWGDICDLAPDFTLLERNYAETHDGEKISRPFYSGCAIGKSGTDTGQALYIPLFSQGVLSGFFQLVLPPGQQIDEIEQLAVSVAQQYLLTVENLRLRERLREQAVRDPLTGLYNRRYLEGALEREISRVQRKELSVGVIMLDIDHFKRFNDQYGHNMGDVVLRQIGLFLHDHVRGGDIACRYGGEEFLVILPEIGLEAAIGRAEALRAGVEALNDMDFRTYPGKLSISLGVAIFPQHGETGQAVMEAADQAMYQAKRAGRNRVRVAENRDGKTNSV